MYLQKETYESKFRSGTQKKNVKVRLIIVVIFGDFWYVTHIIFSLINFILFFFVKILIIVKLE